MSCRTSASCGRSRGRPPTSPSCSSIRRTRFDRYRRIVTIDYYLKQPAEKVTVEILDAATRRSGRSPARRYSLVDAAAGLRRRRREPTMTKRVAAAAARHRPASAWRQGMNRFTWDLRYPGARDFPGLILWAGSTRGPVAPPGRYKVRLTANGVSKTQEFAIVRNASVPTITDRISSSSSRSPSRSATKSRSRTTPCCAFAASRTR